jgi:hypothetical protein
MPIPKPEAQILHVVTVICKTAMMHFSCILNRGIDWRISAELEGRGCVSCENVMCY